jgi:hypothetical protein
MKREPRIKSPAQVRAAALALAAVLASCAPRAPVALIPEGYDSWASPTSIVLDYPVPGHGAGLRKIFMNGEALGYAERALARDPEAAWDFPAGSAIVKEVYASRSPGEGEGPAMLTAMVKAPADPRAVKGWLWVMKDLKEGGELILSSEFCSSCHEGANGTHGYGDKNAAGVFRDGVFMLPRAAPGAAEKAAAEPDTATSSEY